MKPTKAFPATKDDKLLMNSDAQLASNSIHMVNAIKRGCLTVTAAACINLRLPRKMSAFNL